MKIMKMAFFAIMVLLCTHIFAGNDTLRLYNPASVKTASYSPAAYPAQMAWFSLPYPAKIKGFILTLTGDSGVSIRMTFLGHEGGVSFAQLMNPVVPAKTVIKKTKVKEQVWVQIDSAGIEMNNNQFFLLFDQFTGNCRLISDQTDHPKFCSSGDGGTYYYEYVQSTDNNWYLPTAQNRAFAIDVVLEYSSKTSDFILADKTALAGLPENISNSTIATADYNNDGYLDFLVSGKFFENNKNGSFTDITASKVVFNKYSGVSANAFVDMDNDGDLDIILFGGDTSVLFVNNGGVFTEHILNLPVFKSFLSFSFADLNYDGFPDLFVSQLWSTYPEAEPNYFFYNDGNLGFTDQTSKIYPEWDGTWNYPNGRWDPPNYIIEKNRNSRGSQWVDFDNDGDLDLFVVNYFLQQDEFYRNNGDGSFTDICVAKGIDYNSQGANHGTGVDWYDYDNDGDMDLLLPQFAHPRYIGPYDHRGTTIYRNEGAPNYNFTDLVGQINNYPGLKSPIGTELEETHAGGAWGDVNNDGRADFLMTVFYGCRYIDFYEQQPDHTFSLKTFKYGLDFINSGTDIVWADYDNDGRLDLLGGNKNQFRLFKNDVYNNKRFVEIELHGTTVNKFAIGARVMVFAGENIFTQEVTCGRGQKMQKPFRLHFGLGYTPEIDSVIVLWPSNPQKREKFEGLNVNGIYQLTEGGGMIQSATETENRFRIELFPNPSNAEIWLKIDNENLLEIEIFNSLMEKVDVISLPKNNIQQMVSWDAKGKTGIYFFRISDGVNSEIRKVVIQ